MTPPFDKILVIDFETRWSSKATSWTGEEGYTLSKSTTESYIRDKRFKAFGLCVKAFDSEELPAWIPHAKIPVWVQRTDWSRTAVAAHNCVTGDHEVRTRDGWVRFDALLDGVDVLQWNSNTNVLSYTPAVITRQDYAGLMFEWATNYHKGCYTPNHRHYYQTPADSTWRVAMTEALAVMGQNNVYIPTAGVLQAETETPFTPLQARVLEMVRADANITSAFVARFKFKKERKIERCRALLDALGATYTLRVVAGVTCINTHVSAGMREITRLLGVGKSKRLGAWVLSLPLPARQALLDECQYWDGSVATAGGRGQTTVHSSKQEDVYWLTELSILSGRSAKAHYDVSNTRGFSRPDGVLHNVDIRQRARAKLVRPPMKIFHTGVVYCLTTPTSAFLVRRRGATWVTGNSQFDAGILSMIYGAEPCFIFDTLSMGRALRGVEVGNSLKKLAEDFGLPPKGNAVHSTDGLEDLTLEIERELAEYCAHDVALCEAILKRFLVGYPVSELRVIDMTVRMFTQPCLMLDRPMLEKALEEDKTKLAAALQRVQVEEASLASAEQFAEGLRRCGVEPPMKVSKKTGLPAYAFAKNDALFLAIQNGDNEDAALLCEARLQVKSTMARTRAQRFIDISTRGAMPFPVSYYGASTGRYTASKGSSINVQNLKRGSFLRRAIHAPEGYVLGVGDLSQIEPRVIAHLSDYEDMLDIFRSGEDPYAAFGRPMFGVPDLTKESHPLLRQSAKSAMLGASYRLGWASFAAQLLSGFLGAPPIRYTKKDAKQLGVTQKDAERFLGYAPFVQSMVDIPHTCTIEELLVHCLAAKAIIDKYRSTAKPVVKFWKFLAQMLEQCLLGGEEHTYKCLTFRRNEIELANGMTLRYPNVRKQTSREEGVQIVYGEEGVKPSKLHSGVLANNCTQGTARIVMTDGMLRVQKRYPVLMTVHDECGILVPENEAEEALKFLHACMTREPAYLPGIPLEADVGCAKRYGDAK